MTTQLFEELGFVRVSLDKKSQIVYKNEDDQLITFMVGSRACYAPVFITPELHLAIHTQMKELGWIK